MIEASERTKYQDIWALPDYREANSPGLANVDRFLAELKPQPGQSVVDLGCGSGDAGLALQAAGLAVSWLDITDAGLSPQVPRALFFEQPLWHRWPMNADYCFCCDVMEHLPTEFVMLAIDRIVAQSKTAWLAIALRPDVFGAAIGQPLHLTVRDFLWWRDRLACIGTVLDARDLCGDGLYIVSK